jgi:hypothetical protein
MYVQYIQRSDEYVAKRCKFDHPCSCTAVRIVIRNLIISTWWNLAVKRWYGVVITRVMCRLENNAFNMWPTGSLGSVSQQHDALDD